MFCVILILTLTLTCFSVKISTPTLVVYPPLLSDSLAASLTPAFSLGGQA